MEMSLACLICLLSGIGSNSLLTCTLMGEGGSEKERECEREINTWKGHELAYNRDSSDG